MKKDHTGQKFGRLTFVRSTGEKNKSGRLIWELLCDCGTTHYSDYGGVGDNGAKSCGCLKKETDVKNAMNIRYLARTYDPVISSARRLWLQTYNEAGLDFDTFYSLSQQPCDYCGDPPTRTYNAAYKVSASSEYQRDSGNFTYNGLDRVDNSKGHTADNVVPCCFTCNRMKGTMTREEFILHNEKQYAHLHNRSLGTNCAK